MRVGIDATWARVAASGGGSYTHGLVRALASHPEHRFVLYFQKGDESGNPLFHLDGPTVERHIVDGWKQPGRTLVSLSRACVRDELDLFHSPGYFLPLWRGPKVATFHDANMFAQWDKWWATGKRLSWLSLCAQTLLASRLATHIVTDSRSGESSVERLLRLPPERISTVYPGIDDMFFSPSDGVASAAIRTAHDLEEYVLFVGVFSPIKNIDGILRAFGMLRRPGLRLALVGRPYGTYLETVILPLARQLGIVDALRVVGQVPDDARPGLYAGARCLVYPSFGEGFGLPPVEAMACGTPVVASNRPSLPEVLGDAAILVDPTDITGLAAAMQDVLDDRDLRSRLVLSGKNRAARFRWSEAAAQMLSVYSSVL